MSGSRESGLWNWLSKARKHYRDHLHMNRVENALAAGMPDVEGTLLDKQFFIELKSSARPARETTAVRFAVRDRQAQIDWLEARWTLAGNAWLLLQVGSGHRLIRYLVPGCYAETIYDGVTEQKIQTMSYSLIQDTAPDIVRRASRSPL